MVGAQHIEEPHATLIYAENLQNPNQELENTFNSQLSLTYLREERNPTLTPTSRTTISTRRSSGGGGGY